MDAAHEHDAIVFGAWGCGAFRKNPHEIAGLFKSAFESDFRHACAAVVFASLDSFPERRVADHSRRGFQHVDRIDSAV